MSSPDTRTVPTVFTPGEVQINEDPFWPDPVFFFPASPVEIMDWATYIFAASDFLQLFED